MTTTGAYTGCEYKIYTYIHTYMCRLQFCTLLHFLKTSSISKIQHYQSFYVQNILIDNGNIMIFQSFFNLYNQVIKFYLLCTCNISLLLDCIYWWSVIKNIKKSIKNKTDRPSKIIDDVGLSLED